MGKLALLCRVSAPRTLPCIPGDTDSTLISRTAPSYPPNVIRLFIRLVICRRLCSFPSKCKIERKLHHFILESSYNDVADRILSFSFRRQRPYSCSCSGDATAKVGHELATEVTVD